MSDPVEELRELARRYGLKPSWWDRVKSCWPLVSRSSYETLMAVHLHMVTECVGRLIRLEAAIDRHESMARSNEELQTETIQMLIDDIGRLGKPPRWMNFN